MLRLPAFLRRFIRRNTRKRDVHESLVKRRKISFWYMILSWHLIGLVGYSVYVSSAEKDTKKLSGGRYYADLLGHKNIQLTRIEGFRKVGSWDLEEEKRKYGRLLTEEELHAVQQGATEEDIRKKYAIKDEFMELQEKYLNQEQE